MELPVFDDPASGSVEVVVPHVLCGPPECANGGLVGGLLARDMTGTVEVTLRRPVPLDEPVTLERLGPAVLLRRGHEVLALAQPTDPLPDPPPPPTWSESIEATALRAPAEFHPYPSCFVCGPGRPDGLGIRPGPRRHGAGVAAPWIPDASLALNGGLRREFAWGALDCPGGFAALAGDRPRPIVLGRITAEFRAQVPAGEPMVVHGWRMATEGRRHVVGTALHSLDGACLAVARSTWFEV